MRKTKVWFRILFSNFKRKKVLARQWWHKPLIPALEAEAGGQPGLQSAKTSRAAQRNPTSRNKSKPNCTMCPMCSMSTEVRAQLSAGLSCHRSLSNQTLARHWGLCLYHLATSLAAKLALCSYLIWWDFHFLRIYKHIQLLFCSAETWKCHKIVGNNKNQKNS